MLWLICLMLFLETNVIMFLRFCFVCWKWPWKWISLLFKFSYKIMMPTCISILVVFIAKLLGRFYTTNCSFTVFWFRCFTEIIVLLYFIFYCFVVCSVDLLKPGTTVILRNARIDMFKGSMRLAVDKWGRIEVTEPANFVVKEDNNLSLVEYELVNVQEDGGAPPGS